MGGGTWVVDPSLEQQKGAALSLLYAGTHNACTLLEVQVSMAIHAVPHMQFIDCLLKELECCTNEFIVALNMSWLVNIGGGLLTYMVVC